MTNIPWIQLSSRIIENTAAPLDWKTMLSTQDRLNLTTTQRWFWMIVYDTELNKWKQLINHHTNTSTQETDWSDFWWWSWTISINNDIFVVSDSDQKIYWLTHIPTPKSIILTINWLENYEGYQFDLNEKNIIFKTDCNLDVWDIVRVKYFY